MPSRECNLLLAFHEENGLTPPCFTGENTFGRSYVGFPVGSRAVSKLGPCLMRLGQRMNFLPAILKISVVCFFFGGCTGWPQARLDAYLGRQPTLDLARFADASGVVRAGLVVINDTTAPDSAPKLSDSSFAALTAHVQEQLTRAVPIEVVRVTHSANPADPSTHFAAVLQWGKDHRLDCLVVAILSSAEIEVPERFPWRGSTPGAIGRGLLLGYRAENLALAELALIDARAGHVLARVDGYAWASLDRLDVPIESNVYPVVRRDLEDPPVYPEKDANAHDVMRAVAGNDAVNQAVMHLKEAWGRP